MLKQLSGAENAADRIATIVLRSDVQKICIRFLEPNHWANVTMRSCSYLATQRRPPVDLKLASFSDYEVMFVNPGDSNHRKDCLPQEWGPLANGADRRRGWW